MKSSTLFIGISTNHPGVGMGDKNDTGKEISTKLSAPSIVGVSLIYLRFKKF